MNESCALPGIWQAAVWLGTTQRLCFLVTPAASISFVRREEVAIVDINSSKIYKNIG